MDKMDARYWNDRYVREMTGWNVGQATTPIVSYLDQLKEKDINILIPGAGYGHEAAHLVENGFNNTYVCEWSSNAVDEMLALYPDFPKRNVYCENFFDHKGKYDLILEQTFFCALNPNLRGSYVSKVHDLLKPKGKLVGLLFDFPLTEKGPPFGGNKDKYLSYFCDLFKIITLERCYNSIPPRAGNELFLIAKKQIT